MTASLGLGDVLAAASRAAAELVPDSFVLVWVLHGDRLVLRAAAGVLDRACTGLRTTLAVRRGAGGPRRPAPGRRGDRRRARRRPPGAAATTSCKPSACAGSWASRSPPATPWSACSGSSVARADAAERRRRWTRSASWPPRRRSPSRARGSSLTASAGGARAEALAAVSQALAHSLDPRQVSQLIADNVLALLGARRRRGLPSCSRRHRRRSSSVAFAGEGAAGLSTSARAAAAASAPGRRAALATPAARPRPTCSNDSGRHLSRRSCARRARARSAIARSWPARCWSTARPIGALAVAARPRAGRSTTTRGGCWRRSPIRRPSRSTTRGCLPPSGRRGPTPRRPSSASAGWSRASTPSSPSSRWPRGGSCS